MERVAQPLRAMGADVTTEDGHAPLTIQGGDLRGIRFEAEVPSAQVKSAVLLAALAADGPDDRRRARPDAGPHGASARRARGAAPCGRTRGAPRRAVPARGVPRDGAGGPVLGRVPPRRRRAHRWRPHPPRRRPQSDPSRLRGGAAEDGRRGGRRAGRRGARGTGGNDAARAERDPPPGARGCGRGAVRDRRGADPRGPRRPCGRPLDLRRSLGAAREGERPSLGPRRGAPSPGRGSRRRRRRPRGRRRRPRGRIRSVARGTTGWRWR